MVCRTVEQLNVELNIGTYVTSCQAQMENKENIRNVFTIPLHVGFGEIVRRSRVEMGLNRSQAVDLVRESGGELSLKSLSNYEQGKRDPQLEVAIKLIEVLWEGYVRAYGDVLKLDTDEEDEEIDLDLGPGEYKKVLTPVWDEDGKLQYYIRSMYTYLTIEEGEAEKKLDGVG